MCIRLEVRTEERKWVNTPEGFHSKDQKEAWVEDFCKRHGVPYSREFVSVWAIHRDSSQVKQLGPGREAWITRNADAYGKEIILLGEHVVDSLSLVACGDFQNIILEATEMEKARKDVSRHLREMLFIFAPATARAERIAKLEAASARARQLVTLGDAEARLLRCLSNSDLPPTVPP